MMLALLTLLTAADVVRCESGPDVRDGAVVLAVAANRAERHGTTLLGELTRPLQFARACPASPRRPMLRHMVVAWHAVAGTLEVPGWALRAWYYCGRVDAAVCVARGSAWVGRAAHDYYGRTP